MMEPMFRMRIRCRQCGRETAPERRVDPRSRRWIRTVRVRDQRLVCLVEWTDYAYPAEIARGVLDRSYGGISA
jgi:hypothetical protein